MNYQGLNCHFSPIVTRYVSGRNNLLHPSACKLNGYSGYPGYVAYGKSNVAEIACSVNGWDQTAQYCDVTTSDSPEDWPYDLIIIPGVKSSRMRGFADLGSQGVSNYNLIYSGAGNWYYANRCFPSTIPHIQLIASSKIRCMVSAYFEVVTNFQSAPKLIHASRIYAGENYTVQPVSALSRGLIRNGLSSGGRYLYSGLYTFPSIDFSSGTQYVAIPGIKFNKTWEEFTLSNLKVDVTNFTVGIEWYKI